MKAIIFTLSFALFFPSTLQAQGFRAMQRDRFRNHRPPNPLLVTGIVTSSVGSVVTLFGLFLYEVNGDTGGRGSNSSKPAPRNNDGLAIAAAGGGLMVAGVVLIAVGASQHNKSRFALITPKMNEIGLAV